MNLTAEKLKIFWKNKDSIFNKHENHEKRFDKIDTLIKDILKVEMKITIATNEVKIGNNLVKYEKDKTPTIEYFGPSKDEMTIDKAYSGVEQMSKKFEGHEEIVNKVGCILGGFDFKSHKMIDSYRILSNTIAKKDDYHGTLTSTGQSRHPSSHFADNNYFFNIMKFIQDCKNNKEVKFADSRMVMRYPSCHINSQDNKSRFFPVDKDDSDCTNEYAAQREVLKYRFPPKFLWMWANKDKVIHPLSLMAFRNFLNSEFGKKILKNYTPENITNMEFDEFIKIWSKISGRILLSLKIDKEQDIRDLSKLISIIMTQETDIKNISDLLKSGNKAVILWGPPGTGKTYESMQVVQELLGLKNGEDIEKYNFSKKENTHDKGYYEIIQFHPNYTYEDFIGGISPKLDGGNVSYELREGIFKRFCDKAAKSSEKKFIFIIDEINRAELSAVFGELLYALEYRGKSINLPHFGNFTIPENVYIIGTMNNVDKSLVTFDLALRRRFGFFKLMPKLDVIYDVLSERIEPDSLENYVKKCKKLNESIIDNEGLALEKDYQIGQAYFIKIQDFINESDTPIKISSFELEKLWAYSIEPLLEEYLGMSIEDEEIYKKLKKLKDDFLKDV